MDIAWQPRVNGKTDRVNRGTSRQNLQGNASEKRQTENSKQELSYLDLFSTSQTRLPSNANSKSKSKRSVFDECLNNAPYFGYQIDGKRWGVVQGCCNDWNCPRCGQQRARQEYGRIVVGARELGAKYPMYLLTITCRGKELSYGDAERGYLQWTNSFLTRIRTQTKRSGGQWAYASVTERQEREHPHSHFITTYCPLDAILVKKGEGKYYSTVHAWFPAKHDTLQSEILELACAECGLGYQYDISRLASVEAGSRYAAKYLFKAGIFETVWPKGWRRVRYSQNWPKLPDVKTDAMILLSNEDWDNLARKALVVKTKDDGARKFVEGKLRHADVIVQ